MPTPRKADRVKDLRSTARGYTRCSLNVILGLMTREDTPPATRLECAKEMLARGWGRPSMQTEITIEDKRPEAVRQLIEGLLQPGDAAKVIDGQVIDNNTETAIAKPST